MSTENNGTFMQKHTKCQDGINCHGPGCKISSGKTTRKKTK